MATDQSRLEAIRAECQSRLAIVEATHALEMAKALPARRRSLLVFLDRERAMYSFALSILHKLEDGYEDRRELS